MFYCITTIHTSYVYIWYRLNPKFDLLGTRAAGSDVRVWSVCVVNCSVRSHCCCCCWSCARHLLRRWPCCCSHCWCTRLGPRCCHRSCSPIPPRTTRSHSADNRETVSSPRCPTPWDRTRHRLRTVRPRRRRRRIPWSPPNRPLESEPAGLHWPILCRPVSTKVFWVWRSSEGWGWLVLLVCGRERILGKEFGFWIIDGMQLQKND